MAITHVNTTTSGASGSSVTISKPSGVSNGDTLVLWVVTNANQSPSFVGWTRLGSGSQSSFIFTKTASSEPSSYTFTFNGSTEEVAAVLTAWSGVTSATGAYSQDPAVDDKADIGDPGTIVSGSVVLGLLASVLDVSLGDPVSDTWSPSWTLRGSVTGVDRQATLKSTAIGSDITPGSVYCTAPLGPAPRGYVILAIEEEAEGESRSGSAGLRLSAASSIEYPSRSGNAALVITPSSVISDAAARTGTSKLVLSCSSEVLEPEIRDGVSGLKFKASSAYAYENPRSVSAGIVLGASSDPQTGTTKTGTAGIVIGCSSKHFVGTKSVVKIRLKARRLVSTGNNVDALRRMVALNGGRLTGAPVAVSDDVLNLARRVLNV